MTVRELLEVFDEHTYVDIIICQDLYNPFRDEMEETVVCTWCYKEHYDWYYGQLDCFDILRTNELKPYYGSKVKSFFVINEIKMDSHPAIHITIK